MFCLTFLRTVPHALAPGALLGGDDAARGAGPGHLPAGGPPLLLAPLGRHRVGGRAVVVVVVIVVGGGEPRGVDDEVARARRPPPESPPRSPVPGPRRRLLRRRRPPASNITGP